MTTVFHTAAGVVDKAGNQIMYTTSKVGEQLQITTNRVFPLEQRQETLKRAHLFANRNPKLAAFLITQVALTGLPLILFLAFATTTLLASLTTCVLLGLLASLAFTSFIVGVALLFVVPTVIIASCSATFVFIWGFMGYIVLRRFNEGEAPAKPGTRVGDGLQRLTGGRLGQWVADGSGIDGLEKSEGQHASSTSGNSTRNGRYQNSGNTSLEKDGANLNGDSNSHGYVEWDRKWDNGLQPQSVVVETSNPYEVLKTETPVA